jgi:hypothetical protein
MKDLRSSTAVISRWLSDVERLIGSEHNLLWTYHKQVQARVRVPNDSRWDGPRRLAEEAIFPGYKEEIHFAALSLDDRGLPGYGEIFLVLRSSMIAHRTTVFEENNVLFMDRRDPRFSQMSLLEPGYRAPWADRAKLCITKLGARLQPCTSDEDFPALLLRTGATTADDDFVEAHVFGPISILTVEKVVMARPGSGRAALVKQRAWGEKLRKHHVAWEEA